MAILNPALIDGFDKNETNTTTPSSTLADDGYAFGDIPSSANHNFMFNQLYKYLNYLKEVGLSRWDTAVTYSKQSMIARQEVVYFSLGDGNIANDPTTTSDLTAGSPSWISLEDLFESPYYTSGIVNAGSKSTITAVPYFGSISSLIDNKTYGIRIKTGTINFPDNVEINIDGTGIKTATIALPTYDAQLGLSFNVRYVGGGTDEFLYPLGDASTTAKGIVLLDDTVTSTSTSEAATANAAKQAYESNGIIEAGSSIHASGVIKQKIISLSMAIGFSQNAATHGISNAFTNHRIIDVRASLKTGSSIVGGEGNVVASEYSSFWSADNGSLFLNRSVTTNAVTFECLITYV